MLTIEIRTLAIGLLTISSATLLGSLIAIGWRVENAWPWMEIVHEDGRRTLLQTVLYLEHATRELPLDILLGLAIGGCLLVVWPPDQDPSSRRDFGKYFSIFGFFVLGIILTVIGGTTVQHGGKVALDNLLQLHTRAGEPLAWGHHWLYHFWSRLSLILLSFGVAGLLHCLNGAPTRESRIGARIALGVLALYFLVTVIFSSSWSAFSLTFSDTRFIGHQARELATHSLITLPAAWGLGMFAFGSGKANLHLPRSGTPTPLVAAGVLGALIGACLCFAAMLTDATAQAQTPDIATLIFPHVFEHSISYILVPAVASLTYNGQAFRQR